MSPWRQKAEEMFPELVSRFEEADTPYLLWFELREAFERASSSHLATSRSSGAFISIPIGALTSHVGRLRRTICLLALPFAFTSTFLSILQHAGTCRVGGGPRICASRAFFSIIFRTRSSASCRVFSHERVTVMIPVSDPWPNKTLQPTAPGAAAQTDESRKAF